MLWRSLSASPRQLELCCRGCRHKAVLGSSTSPTQLELLLGSPDCAVCDQLVEPDSAPPPLGPLDKTA